MTGRAIDNCRTEIPWPTILRESFVGIVSLDLLQDGLVWNFFVHVKILGSILHVPLRFCTIKAMNLPVQFLKLSEQFEHFSCNKV